MRDPYSFDAMIRQQNLHDDAKADAKLIHNNPKRKEKYLREILDDCEPKYYRLVLKYLDKLFLENI